MNKIMKNENIKILDCSLRDGGYKFDWEIPLVSVKEIASSLVDSKVDFIEAGYIRDDVINKKKTTLFNSIEQAESLFVHNNNPKILLMFNQGEFSATKLIGIEKSNIISGFRIAFHKNDYKDAIKSAIIIKKLGYSVFFQPMIVSSYSLDQFKALSNEVSRSLDPDGFYIVDSFGAIVTDQLLDYFNILSENSNKNMMLGYHAHNNLQLAFANSIAVINKIKDRRIIIDCSLMGIGRGAGNLPTELITEYLNSEYNSEYDLISIYSTLKNSIIPLSEKKKWGYSFTYFLSAKYHCHPKYAEELMKLDLSADELHNILTKIMLSFSNSFDKVLFEKILYDFKKEKNDTVI